MPFSCPHNCFKLTGRCCLPLVCWSFSWFNFSQMPSVQCVEVSNTPTVLVMYTTFESKSKLKARQLCLQAQSCNTTFESALKIKVRQVCFQADLAHDQLIPPPPPPPPTPPPPACSRTFSRCIMMQIIHCLGSSISCEKMEERGFFFSLTLWCLSKIIRNLKSCVITPVSCETKI